MPFSKTFRTGSCNFRKPPLSLPDVICVQETFLKENKVFNLDCYEVVRRDRVGTAGGDMATFIKSGINYKVLNNPTGIECIVIEIKCNGVKYVIVSVYNPPDVEMDKAVYTDLFKLKNAATSMQRVLCGKVVKLIDVE